MNLKNCKITIEPKGEPENTVVFFNADCQFDEEFFTKQSIPMPDGFLPVSLHLAVRPDPTIKDTSINIGYYGQPTNKP